MMLSIGQFEVPVHDCYSTKRDGVWLQLLHQRLEAAVVQGASFSFGIDVRQYWILMGMCSPVCSIAAARGR